MKCPKCGYLGFDRGDRCRNCGYDFSLSPALSLSSPAAARKADLSGAPDPLDLALDAGPEPARLPVDLDRLIGEPAPGSAGAAATSAPAADVPLFAQTQVAFEEPAPARPESLGGARRSRQQPDDVPLITTPPRPRAPLGVRRATPEIPRARTVKPTPARGDSLFEAPRGLQPTEEPRTAGGRAASGQPMAGPFSRIMAGLIDALLVFGLDAGVLYFTSRLTGAQVLDLPLLPLSAFLLLLNGGYFVVFTAFGGQTIGKMAFGLKVTTEDEESVPVSRAALRTIGYLVSALPLGAGFLAAVFTANRLAFHDRLAHTRVVRPSST
jgi:uncharacterized RDD family membrane protein YckC